jgi:transcriptional regulator with XRE-family HTH domain
LKNAAGNHERWPRSSLDAHQHDHEEYALFIPTAQPADPPAIDAVPGRRCEQDATIVPYGEKGRIVKTVETLGERIRERRRASALSQTELAERLDVSQATISLWEKGKGTPGKDQILKLDEILGGLMPASEEVTEAESQTPVAAWLSRALARKDLTVGELAAKADVSAATVYGILSGRAQNPHPRTTAALEKALGDKFESKDDVRAASEIAGIGELIDFNPYDQKEIPTKAGVYVLYDISQRPIYVGKASKIALRLNDHSTRFWFKRPLVETGAYIEIQNPLLRDQIETVLIQFLKNNAVINKQKTVRDED